MRPVQRSAMHDTFKPPEGFETRAAAKKRCAHKIQILRGGNAQEQLLAEKLEACRKDDLCGSAACDVDLGFFRLWLSLQSLAIFDDRLFWTRGSVIPAGFLIPIGELPKVSLQHNPAPDEQPTDGADQP